MEHLKLFENFDSKYLWPEAKFWIDKLEPEELCFLGVYSHMLEKNSKQPLFEVEYDGTYEAQADEDGEGSFEMNFIFHLANAETDPSLYCTITYSGSYSPYHSGDYYNPPEGGDYQLNDIEIESAYYLDKDEANEYDLDKIEYKSEFITKAYMFNLLEFIASYFISSDDDNTDFTTPEIPQGLKDKCENLRNEIPNVTKGAGMLSRFTRK